ncbi:MAG: hypothetical protein GWN84_19170 [Gammaproteobacteria bacterium]|nr:hypothetical protein [Gammaproteobacteria bacterium]NIR84949.1 hypothetical protein [Gammaproteobacteria bacterium]NIR91798.1 hypothetical protein [Gammaproteobacteria bacterium]NIU05996.1 hypothetical protein [Gammaproteobacteria bacterium]NIV53043.1 hypothetical protein [Gammaproteobacteria bacterium]
MSDHPAGRVLLLAVVALACVAARGVPEPPRQTSQLVHPVAAAENARVARSGAGQVLDATDAYRVALLKMKAHLNVARALTRQGAPGANYHLRGPAQEIYKDLAGELERRGATLTGDIVQQLDRAAEEDSHLAIGSALDTATTAVDNSLVRTGRMTRRSLIEVSRSLFRDAVEAYRKAVSDHAVVDTHKYQTGGGYVAVADALTRRVRRSTPASEAYERLRNAVALLREAWPAVVPPRIANGPDAVAAWLAGVESALDDLMDQRERISGLGVKRGSFAAPVAVWCTRLALGEASGPSASMRDSHARALRGVGGG